MKRLHYRRLQKFNKFMKFYYMRKKWWLLIPLLLLLIYFLGPKPKSAVYSTALPTIPAGMTALETYIRDQEATHHLKPDNEARIVWADSGRNKTAYAIVYLHGFSASQGEGAPTDLDIAKKYGCNLFLSRLAEHGIDTPDAMVNLTAEEYWASAQQALVIGEQLGTKVILMGTSTGGTLAIQLAAAYPDKVAGLVLLSPNIAINDPNAWLLNDHWGLQIARMVSGGKYIDIKEDYGPMWRQYWYPKYRLEAAVALEELLETTMNEKTFSQVKQPVGLYYFYKDNTHQDSTVKVSAELSMFDELGTPTALKYKEAIPEAGTHVIGSSLRSHAVPAVEEGISHFLSDVMHLPVATDTLRGRSPGTYPPGTPTHP